MDTAQTGAAPLAGISLATAVDLQDELLTAATDLERLLRLIDAAGSDLTARFMSMQRWLGVGEAARGAGAALRRDLAGALTTLQFQDMANQLVTHVNRRLRAASDVLASCADPDDSVPTALLQPRCPVGQRAMDAGSAELF